MLKTSNAPNTQTVLSGPGAPDSRPIMQTVASAALGLFLTVLVTLAAKAECPMGANDLTLTVIHSPVQIDRSKSLAEVQKLFKETIHDPDVDLVLAFTTSSYSGSWTFWTEMNFSAKGFCAVVKSGEVEVHAELTIFVPREVQPGSCVDEVLLEHERKHVEVTKEADDTDLAPMIKERTANRAPGVEAPGVEDFEWAQRHAASRAAEILDAALDEFMETLVEKNKPIDEDEDAEIISDRCGGDALVALIRAF